MKYSVDKNERYSVFMLEEKNLNSIVAPDLKSEFIFLRNEGVPNLIFDMKDVEYIDSSGLSSILTANRLWKGYGAFIIIGATHPMVKKLISISRLETILTILPSMAEATDFIAIQSLKAQIEEEE